MVSAVTLHTTDGQTYGLRHVAEIWHGTKLGFEDTGVYAGLQGKTIDKITYYLNDGTVRTISTNITVPYSSRGASVSVADAAIVLSRRPATLVAEYALPFGEETPLKRRENPAFSLWFERLWKDLNV